MSNLNFIVIDNEIVNVDQISNIVFDEQLNDYTIIMRNNVRHIRINEDQCKQLYDHLKHISNSFIEIN